MSKTSPGIVLVSKYVSGKSSKFGKYIDYINREEAVRSKHFKVFNINKLDGYNNYMENPEKSKGIFTQNKSELTKSEREELKNIFSLAQKNNSIMWQDVISFNNEWLEKNGLYKSETGWINEGAIQDSVRRGMALVLKEECMEQSGVWSASMHFNTDNIHVHIALVEPHPTKPYKRFTDKKTGKEYTARVGNRKAKTLDKFKSKVANNLLERDKELAKISELIHKKIAPKTLKLKPSLDMQMLKVYNEIYKSLPNDMRLWKYNNNAMAQLRPQVNSVIDMYLKNNHPEDFKELDKALIEEMKFREDIYGTGDKDYKRYEDYRTNKHQELYAKLGNAILREMKEIRKGHIQNNIYSKDLEILNDDNTSKENISNINNQINKDFKEPIDSDNTRTQTEQSNDLIIDNTELEKNSDIIFKENNITIDSENQSIHRKEFEKNSYPISETNNQINKDFKELINSDNTKTQVKQSKPLTIDNTGLEKNNEIILEENITNSDSENKSTNKKEFEKNSYTMHDNNYNSKDHFDRYNKT
ncbi:MobP2 family relaxase, partial [Paraclostridium bifermentans]|uniref:MobP2 family relaxase n=1 Tax=Paraclostridium bifermentans TaxID=1490 RepID=UPI0022E93179